MQKSAAALYSRNMVADRTEGQFGDVDKRTKGDEKGHNLRSCKIGQIYRLMKPHYMNELGVTENSSGYIDCAF